MINLGLAYEVMPTSQILCYTTYRFIRTPVTTMILNGFNPYYLVRVISLTQSISVSDQSCRHREAMHCF